MIKIYHDKEKTKEVEDKLIEKYARNDKVWSKTGYNVSECTGCELKCFCRRTGIEETYTKQSIGFLVFGIVSESIVMGIYPKSECQYETNLSNLVTGHLDVFENLQHPIEGKATAKRIFKREHLPQVWVMQLINYLTMTGATKGWLYILDIFTRTFSAWCVEIGEEERLMQIEVLMNKVSRFNKAIPANDPTELTVSPKEYSLCHFKRKCPKRIQCKKAAKIIADKEKAEKELRKQYKRSG